MKHNAIAITGIIFLLLLPLISSAEGFPIAEHIEESLLVEYVFPFINVIFIFINIFSKKKFKHPLVYFRLPLNLIGIILIVKFIAGWHGFSQYRFLEGFTDNSTRGLYLDCLFIAYLTLIIIDYIVILKKLLPVKWHNQILFLLFLPLVIIATMNYRFDFIEGFLSKFVIPILNIVFIGINMFSPKKFRHPIIYTRLPLNFVGLFLIVEVIAASWDIRYTLKYFWEEVFTSRSNWYSDILFIIYLILIVTDTVILVRMRAKKRQEKSSPEIS